MEPNNPAPTPKPPQQKQPGLDGSSHPVAPDNTHNDEGQVLAIIGLFLIPIFPLAGLIVSLTALKKSKSHTNARIIAIIGSTINGLLTLFALIIFGIFLQDFEKFQKNSERTKTAQDTAYSAQSIIHSYAQPLDNMTAFPTQMGKLNDNQYVRFGPLNVQPKNPRIIEYAVCNDAQIARLGYWNYTKNYAEYIYIKVPGTEPKDCIVVSK